MSEKMQHPAGGCESCGGPVRSYKSGIGWMCSTCVREGRHVARGYETPGQLAARKRR